MTYEPMTVAQIRRARAALDRLEETLPPMAVGDRSGTGPETGASATLPAATAPVGATTHPPTADAFERATADGWGPVDVGSGWTGSAGVTSDYERAIVRAEAASMVRDRSEVER